MKKSIIWIPNGGRDGGYGKTGIRFFIPAKAHRLARTGILSETKCSTLPKHFISFGY
jgi:hypothetical protein